MANETMNQFTDDLFRQKIFHCNICDELCTSDIFLVKGKGNVCAICLKEKCQKEIKSKAILNSALMLIIAKLILPCKFKSKGCDERVEYKKYSKHINGTCDFKVKPCPMTKFNLESCDWRGNTLEFSGHILRNHQDQVVKSENNIFNVETSLAETFNVMLLSDDYRNCLLKTSVVGDKFYYSLTPVGKSEENMEYTVVHKRIQTFTSSKVSKHSNDLVLKTIGTLTKLNGFYDEQNLNKNPNATVVDINLLKHLADENNMISNEFNLNPNGLDENMLKLLQCPVCMSVMRPPIYQCNSGHSICNKCRGNVRSCPTCRGELGSVRNYGLESFTSNVKYPCKFKISGCKVTGVEGEIKKHEESCMVNKHKCPICPEFLHTNDISKHVEAKHRDCILKDKRYKIQYYSKCHGYKVYDSKLFRISYHTENSYVYFAAELICPIEDPSKMANETMNQFTDDLLKKKIFHCQICDELCTSDIFLVQGKGNVCANCLEEKCGKEMKSRAELNTALILIIARLMLPCKFNSKGCDERMDSKSYSQHVEGCYFKMNPCPMKILEDCDWSGSISEFSGHILKNHQDQVIKSENNIFNVETSLAEPFNVKLLSDDYQNCLLKTSVVDDKLYYSLTPVGKSEENMEYTVVHKSIQTFTSSKVSKHSNDLVLKTIGTLTKLNGFYDEQNLNKNPNATVVDINLLKHLADENNMISNEFNLNPNGLDENMLKLLQCPGCMSVMRPPIYQCNSGHSICNKCRGNVRSCPTCRGELGSVRNYGLESFTSNVKYPCKFKISGCKVTGAEGEIKKHEESCMVSIRKCPICPEFVNTNDISKHVEDKHRDCILKNKRYKIQHYSKCHGYKVYDSKLFRISYHTENSCVYFAAELISPNVDPSEYFCKVRFYKNKMSTTVDKSMLSTCLKEEPLFPGFKIKGNVRIPVDDFEKFSFSIKGGYDSIQLVV
ncbi:unnamed protein product [Brassicogethes aeneus]|uniref:RING-type E3 ubiquitin transferase n=1 Tax=Brassicogethes aeneus TaxID=1431903 RepID=A0A9P0FE66_BRAAE|nr:unnamed protein product [Brassicogethes aeneus]